MPMSGCQSTSPAQLSTSRAPATTSKTNSQQRQPKWLQMSVKFATEQPQCRWDAPPGKTAIRRIFIPNSEMMSMTR